MGTTCSAVAVAGPTARQIRHQSHRPAVKPKSLSHAGDNTVYITRYNTTIRTSLSTTYYYLAAGSAVSIGQTVNKYVLRN